MSDPKFSEFWPEHRKNAIAVTIQLMWEFPLSVFVTILLLMLKHSVFPDQSEDFYKLEDLLLASTWEVLWEATLKFGPIFLFVMIPICNIVLLEREWSRYQEDKPSELGVYMGHTVPSGKSLRSSFERLISGEAWERFTVAKFERFNESAANVSGNLTDPIVRTMVESVSKRFTTFLRKPTTVFEHGVEWHIHARNGDEVKLRFERDHAASAQWVLTASFFEWAGRKHPPRLAQTHVTRFFGQALA